MNKNKRIIAYINESHYNQYITRIRNHRKYINSPLFEGEKNRGKSTYENRFKKLDVTLFLPCVSDISLSPPATAKPSSPKFLPNVSDYFQLKVVFRGGVGLVPCAAGLLYALFISVSQLATWMMSVSYGSQFDGNSKV